MKNPGARIKNAGFTLIELLVALGLMAILLTMIAQIFFSASQSFRLTRAMVAAHQNARAALDIMLRDFTGARLTSYGVPVPPATAASTGYFHYEMAVDQEYDPAASPPLPQLVPSLAFTTATQQSGVLSIFPSESDQLALVRYTLQWDGRQAQVEQEDGTKKLTPIYNLVKQVRLPDYADPALDMSKWVPNLTTDVQSVAIATSNTMNAAGAVNSALWAGNGLAARRYCVRITQGPGAGQVRQIIGSSDSPLQLTISGQFSPVPDGSSKYQVYPTITSEPIAFNVLDMRVRVFRRLTSNGMSEWRALPAGDDQMLPSPPNPANTYNPFMYDQTVDAGGAGVVPVQMAYSRLPYMAEITLTMADDHILQTYKFTERFYLPGSEQ